LAKELGDISKACKVMSVTRDTFYRYQALVQNGELDSLIDKNRVDPEIEQAVIESAIEYPA
jgi:ACT domain-containing protein